MAKKQYVSPAEAAEGAVIVPVGEVLKAVRPRHTPKAEDPENYRLETLGGLSYYAPTHKRGEALRALFQAHVEHLDAEFGWRGRVSATVPAAIAPDVREAMDFIGALVDDEDDIGDGTVRLFSEGYYAHGF